MKTMGNSSMASGTSSGGTSMPVSTPPSTSMSATGSAPSLRLFFRRMLAPMRPRMSSTPVRVGLTPTPVRVRRLPAVMAAATMKNAAEEMSPGTVRETGFRRAGAVSAMRPSSTDTGHPMAWSMRSVWSRVGAGSTTAVSPSAYSPASRTADLTCALATGSRYSMPVSALPPRTRTGGRPSRVATRAFISPSGSATRAIGRRISDSSPTSSVSNAWPAKSPENSRMDVPELPRSSAAGGARSPVRPTPWMTSSRSPTSSMRTPICSIA